MKMNEVIKNRKYNQQIIWEGDLKDDCTAKWSGLMLRAEWMDEDYWWWCVYDNLNNDIQIDSSNEYDERFIGGEIARNKAEEIAKEYLKNELVLELKKSQQETNFDELISNLKAMGISPMQSIMTLIKDFDFEYSKAKDKVFDSPVWKGLRQQSENLTQAFLNIAAEDADNVEYYDDEHVSSITFDLTKEDLNKKQTFWDSFKSRMKK
ncbi:hypothetical protein [Aquimarina litoralis]|uniref:hypothetical protein n=1 Tax=Aquimarina litoralis TaxID=584605 RepID=UPI001C567D08|nr:hypothetical protein [Aquimarina litoralis]MBW1296355.1 hypothetical protein [Aquimarina litoralis]